MIVLLSVFGKNEKANLTAAEKRRARELAKEFKQEFDHGKD